MSLAIAMKRFFGNCSESLREFDAFELLVSVIVFYYLITFSEIEILSKYNLLSYGICRFTFIVTVILFVLFYIGYLNAIGLLKFRAVKITRFTKIVILFNFLILLETLIYRPNNWDSMTYHLPRIEHWLNNGNLEFYSTSISRQNWSPPFGDFLSLVPHSIFHNDYFDSIFSFISLLILEICVGLILNRITTRRTLKVSLFILILSPSVVLEATTTQVDLRASSLAVAALVLLGSKSEILQPFSILTLGLAAGMKVPSIFSIIPFILIIPSYRNNLLKLKIIPSTILGLIATFVNLPWLIRNYSGYGSFFGEANVNRLQPGWAILKLAINPALFVERLLGILFSNIGLPIFTSINTHLFSFLKSISHSLRNLSHLPVSQYWPDITTAGFGINEDVAPNLVFVVFFISLVAYFLYKKRMKMALQLLLPLLFFVFFIEWQIWINRLLISTIVTVALVSVYVLNKESKGFPENLLKIFALCSIVVSTLFLLVSNDRGLLRVPMVPFGSNQDYFRQKPYLFESYSSLSNDLKTLKIKRVNLVSSTDSWEYPLWAMNPGVKFESFKGGKTPTLCLDTCTIRKDDSSYVPFDFGNAVELFVPRRSS